MKRKKVRMVELKTTIAQGLHVTDDSAGYDAACKRVLSEKAILARIMKSCLEEYKDCDVNDIAEKYIEGQPEVSAVPVLPDEGGTVISGMDTEDKSVREGTVTYDIRFRAIVPDSEEQIALIINVEAQNDFYPGYPLIKRGIYYCCRMISSQYGREFTGSHYEKIKKVYSIWICMKPPQYRENTITRYRLVEEYLVGEGKEPIRNYDLLSIIMLCLGGPDGSNYDGVLRMLDVLLSNETSEAEKRKILQDDYDIQMTQTMEREVSVMCNLSKGVEEKGVAKGILSSIKNLMETMGLTIEQAMAALKVPEGERQKYMDLLERQRTTITLKIKAVRNLKSARLFITFSLNYSWCKMIIVERKMSVSDTMIPAKHLHERLLTESRAIHITIVTVLICMRHLATVASIPHKATLIASEIK